MTDTIWNGYWDNLANHERWLRPAPQVLALIASHSPAFRPAVLDLGCGLGRHAIACAMAGFRVTAIDVSESGISYLRDWAARLNLAVDARVAEVIGNGLPKAAFDIVISYNVIYHGSRAKFAASISEINRLLRPGGILYFTCPSRRDGKYGHGEEVAPHTYACTNSITPGDIHYFSDEAELAELLAGFKQMSRECEEGYWENQGKQQFYSIWHIVAEKK